MEDLLRSLHRKTASMIDWDAEHDPTILLSHLQYPGLGSDVKANILRSLHRMNAEVPVSMLISCIKSDEYYSHDVKGIVVSLLLKKSEAVVTTEACLWILDWFVYCPEQTLNNLVTMESIVKRTVWMSRKDEHLESCLVFVMKIFDDLGPYSILRDHVDILLDLALNCIRSDSLSQKFFQLGGLDMINRYCDGLSLLPQMKNGLLLHNLKFIIVELEQVCTNLHFEAFSSRIVLDLQVEPTPELYLSEVQSVCHSIPEQHALPMVHTLFQQFQTRFDEMHHFCRITYLDAMHSLMDHFVDIADYFSCITSHMVHDRLYMVAPDIAVRFGRMMCGAYSLPEFRKHLPAIWFTLKVECTDKASLLALNEEFVFRWKELECHPNIAVSGVRLFGPSTSDIIFHVCTSLLPGGPLPPGEAGAHLEVFLRANMDKNKTSIGGSKYNLEVVEHFCFENEEAHPPLNLLDSMESALSTEAMFIRQNAISKCPISLMPIHFPVIMSDGVTYELNSIMKLFHNGFDHVASPITRVTFEPWAIINQQVRNTDKELSEVIQSLCRRRTARRIRRDTCSSA